MEAPSALLKLSRFKVHCLSRGLPRFNRNILWLAALFLVSDTLPAQPVARLLYGTYRSTPSAATASDTSTVTVPSPVAVDALGNSYIAAPVQDFTATLLSKISPEGHTEIFATTLDHSQPTALLVDQSGNIYLAGTASDGFEATPGAFQGQPGYGFLAKFDAAGLLLWATFVSAVPTALAVDNTGTPYLCGYTDTAFFSTTSGALKTDLGPALCFAPYGVVHPCNDAVIAKFTPDGTRLLYGTYLGGVRTDNARSIQIDSSGAIWVAGDTQSPDFPVTPDALQSGLNLSQSMDADALVIPSDAFLTVLKPDGSGLLYSTFFGGSASDAAYALLLEGDGSYYLIGGTASPDFPSTPGAYQSMANLENLNSAGFGDAFFARFDTTHAVRYASFYGTSEPESARAAALSPRGTLDFLDGSYPRRGCDPDITLVSVDRGTGQVVATEGVHGVAFQTATLAIDSRGIDHIGGHAILTRDPFALTPDALATLGSTLLLRINLTLADDFVPVCVTNAASYAVSLSAVDGPALAPGELVSVFGYGLNGASVRIVVNGVDALVLYSDAHQINAALPLNLSPGTASFEVIRDGFAASYALPITPVFPGLFMANGQAIVLNANGSLNGPANPAALGSLISVFATGLGSLDGNGQVANPFHVTFGAGPLIEYKTVRAEAAGQAPGFETGVYRVDVLVPEEASVPISWVRLDFDAPISVSDPAQTVWFRRP